MRAHECRMGFGSSCTRETLPVAVSPCLGPATNRAVFSSFKLASPALRHDVNESICARRLEERRKIMGGHHQGHAALTPPSMLLSAATPASLTSTNEPLRASPCGTKRAFPSRNTDSSAGNGQHRPQSAAAFDTFQRSSASPNRPRSGTYYSHHEDLVTSGTRASSSPSSSSQVLRPNSAFLPSAASYHQNDESTQRGSASLSQKHHQTASSTSSRPSSSLSKKGGAIPLHQGTNDGSRRSASPLATSDWQTNVGLEPLTVSHYYSLTKHGLLMARSRAEVRESVRRPHTFRPAARLFPSMDIASHNVQIRDQTWVWTSEK